MISSLLPQSCAVRFVRFTWVACEMRGKWQNSCFLVGWLDWFLWHINRCKLFDVSYSFAWMACEMRGKWPYSCFLVGWLVGWLVWLV